MPDGTEVLGFTLSNDHLQVTLIEYGAIISSIRHDGTEICLGYDTLPPYLADQHFIGITVGRYANRIAGARFTLCGEYTLDVNEAPNHLHGGAAGFGKQLWQGAIIDGGVAFQRVSPDGEMGYPGALDVCVKYTLEGDKLLVNFNALSDRDTYVSLTNHSYFNLAGGGLIEDHVLCLNTASMTPMNAENIPTGEVIQVVGTAFDFTSPQRIADRDFDTNYINNNTLSPVANVLDKTSGRALHIETSQPCTQFYTGNALKGAPARDGRPLAKHAAFCLEPQDYPDGPNCTNFPTKPLLAGVTYHHWIEYHFSNAHETGVC